MIGLSPSEFWDASHTEVVNAITGFGDFHSAGQEKVEPMTSERMHELMEMYPDKWQHQ